MNNQDVFIDPNHSTENIVANKELVAKFPFLLPRSRWTGKAIDSYDYSYTELDDMPDGWRKAFGIRMCEELRDALIEANFLNDYRIMQIKEKFGYLHWYDNGHTDEIRDIISKYEHISGYICIICGKPYPEAAMVNDYWILPYCRTCFKGNDEDYNKLVDHEPIKDKIVFDCYTKNGKYKHEITIKDTWNAIVDDYYKKEANI